MSNALIALLNIFAPPRCPICGRDGRAVCSACLTAAIKPIYDRCFSCKARSRDCKTCDRCRRRLPLSHVWAVSDYGGDMARLIGCFKFGRLRELARPLSLTMAAKLPYGVEFAVVPVPTATGRVRARGYDHARLLARSLSEATNLDFLPALRRLGQARQTGSGRARRSRQLQGAFWVAYPHLVKGRQILLVDDVLTTGSTLTSAARALKRAGAKSIAAAVLAQKN